MSFSQASRLAQLFTPTYASRINAQLVHPAASVVVKPHELASALTRPLQTSVYEPDRSAVYLAATLSYGLMKGHPFMDGNKRTAFFLANEYLRAQGLSGLVGTFGSASSFAEAIAVAERYIGTAAGQLDIGELAHEQDRS